MHPSEVLGESLDAFEDADFIVKIKCAYTFHNMSVPDILSDPKRFVLVNEFGKAALKMDHGYYHQCQRHMWLANSDQVHLVIWLPSGSLQLKVFKDQAWEVENQTLQTKL